MRHLSPTPRLPISFGPASADSFAFLHPRPCRCGGRGKTIKHYCPSCKGARIVDTVSDLDLHIDRGMPEGEEIVFEGEADESPDLEAGDVVVRVRSKKEKGGFVRKDSNLYWKEPISVAEVRFPPPSPESIVNRLRRLLDGSAHRWFLDTGIARFPTYCQRTRRSRHCAFPNGRHAARSAPYFFAPAVFPRNVSCSHPPNLPQASST